MIARVKPRSYERPILTRINENVCRAGASPAQLMTRQAERLPYNSKTHACARPERTMDRRSKYKADAATRTTAASRRPARVSFPVELSLSADCPKIQTMARIASAGTIFIPGKLNGSPSERTSRWIKAQQAAQQSRYINRTATFERTASRSNVPLTESTNASAA